MISMTRKINFSLIVVLLALSAGCQPPVAESTSTTEPTSKPVMLQTLEVGIPDFEVFFDGNDCIVKGPDDIKKGEYLVVLHNQTELMANLTLMNYPGEGSYEEHLAWRENNNCGQGIRCENEKGELLSYNAVWMNAIKQSTDGITTSYKIYDVSFDRQYSFYVGSDNRGWLCGSVEVIN
jgi:hypothetical protein